MNEKFLLVKPETIEDNLFKLIGTDWMLITAGKADNYNMMTASWGCAGVLWRKPIAVTFIRPQRHTFGFMEKHPWYTISFFGQEHRELLNLCGTVSGRDMNKMNIDGLTPMLTPAGNVSFNEARLVLECRKIYYDDIKPELFLSFDIEKIYPGKDYHRFYIGEIANAWQVKN